SGSRLSSFPRLVKGLLVTNLGKPVTDQLLIITLLVLARRIVLFRPEPKLVGTNRVRQYNVTFFVEPKLYFEISEDEAGLVRALGHFLVDVEATNFESGDLFRVQPALVQNLINRDRLILHIRLCGRMKVRFRKLGSVDRLYR